MTTRQLPRHTEVLIVGAGPTGLTLAATLAQLGVDHVIVDSKAGIAPGTKAAAVQPRSLEYLDRIDVASVLVEDGLAGSGFVLASPDRDLLRVPYTAIASPFPHLLLVGQEQTEVRLHERLVHLGGSVQRGVSLIDLRDGHPGSTALLADDSGAVHAISARYVAACDGLHSAVRELAGVGFPGVVPESKFAVADVVLAVDDGLEPAAGFVLSPNGMLITSPLPGGVVRIVAAVPPDYRTPDADDIETLIRQRGGASMRDAHIDHVVSSSVYHVQERVAETMATRRIFLLGDAAHTHSPAGGQGMNTGIQDAANLGWKLHAVLANGADEALLATYDAERRPVAKNLIDFTSKIIAVTTIHGEPGVRNRNALLEAAGAMPELTGWLAAKLSQLDIGYAPPDEPTPIGSRIDPRLIDVKGLEWAVLVPASDDDGAAAVALREAGVAVSASATVDQPIAVRPDGIGAGLDELAAACRDLTGSAVC